MAVPVALHPESAVRSEADTRRPIITHLTADNSWLIQIPRSSGDRLFFNILIDPWLTGPQIQYYRWVHNQGHTEICAADSIADVESFCANVEVLARKFRPDMKREASQPASYIDAVALSLAENDHTHEETLMQLHPGVPIYAQPAKAVAIVKGFKHFETVQQAPSFTGNWKDTSISPLPSDIGISSIMGNDFSGLHVGLVISFQCLGSSQPESIVYMPHGMLPADLSALAEASPRVSVLALLHGCLRVEVGLRWKWSKFPANMGGRNALEVSRKLDSKYWIHTHDERKTEEGLTSWILSHDLQTVEQVTKECARDTGQAQAEILKKANYHDLGNGGSLVLV